MMFLANKCSVLLAIATALFGLMVPRTHAQLAVAVGAAGLIYNLESDDCPTFSGAAACKCRDAYGTFFLTIVSEAPIFQAGC